MGINPIAKILSAKRENPKYNHFKVYIKMFFFFLRENFNLWRPLLIIALYHQIKTPISFWCRQELNLRSLIQPSETLPVELAKTHFTSKC